MHKILSKKQSLVLRVNSWLHTLPVWQNAVVAAAVWFWMLTLFGDLNRILFPPLLASSIWNINEPLIPQYILLCFLVLFFIGGCFIAPVCFAGWGIHHIFDYFKYHRKGFSRFLQITEYIGWLFALFIMVFFPLGILTIAEQLIHITLLPFVTLLGSVLWIPLGLYLTRNLSKVKSTAIISMMLVLVLSLPYWDWSSQKSFIRDLSNLKTGMTGIEVERIMKSHRHNFVLPEEEHFLHLNPAYTGTTVFRPRRASDMGIIEFKDGKVVGVRFEND